MSDIQIDADALFRAVTAYDYKLLAYYLDLRTGEINSRTLMPDEIQEPPPGPRVQPLPRLGGELDTPKGEAPFGPPPVTLGKKPDLFKDDALPKKSAFEGDFWKRPAPSRKDPFGGAPLQRKSGTQKLAELFGEAPPEKKRKTPFPEPLSGKIASGARTIGGQDARATSQAPGAKSVARASGPHGDSGTIGGQDARATSQAPGAKSQEPSAPPPSDPDEPLRRIPPASAEQHLDWMRAFARESGDPKIRERLERTLTGKPKDRFRAFARVLRNYQRLNQQWERYFRRQALHYAAAWLETVPVSWDIVESGER